jgi:hypothetical protein
LQVVLLLSTAWEALHGPTRRPDAVKETVMVVLDADEAQVLHVIPCNDNMSVGRRHRT